jgi:hypothetical protein
MAIVTDQTVTIHGVSVGISKPIQTLIANGDFTYTELSKFAFVGRYDFVNDVAGMFDSYGWSSGDSSVLANENKFPVLNSPSGNWDSVLYTYFGSVSRNHENYGKMILVYNMVNSDNNISAAFNDNNTACIVTEINPRLLKIIGHVYSGSVVATVGETGSYTIYDSEGNDIVWYDDDTTAPFRALEIQQFDDKNFYVFPLYNNIFISYEDINGNKSSTNAMMQFMIGDYNGSPDGYVSWWKSSELILDFLQGADYSGNFVGANDLSNDRGDVLLTVAYTPYSAVIRCRASSEDTALKQIAGSGLYFEVDNVVYKPITTDGVVTGYTADLTKNSEWDLINDVTGNTIPDTPGGGGGSDEDNNDPISTTDAPFGSGLAHYYVTTAGSVILEHISEALGSWDIDSSKKDLYRNLISCKLIKSPAAIPTSGSEDFTIYGVKPLYQGSPVTISVVSGNPSATFGPYSISRKFNDFRDFAPYSKAEIFLPYCGWTALPSHVIGRSVSVKYFTDIIAATCKAVVFCGNNVVAEAAGVIGLDIPFASENVGAKMEAANMGLLASTLGAVQTAVGVGTMVSTKSGSGVKNVTSGLSQVISGCTQISMAGNENWTEINGKAGDGCSLSGINTIIIKITRPKYGTNNTAPYVPSGYGHNIGYVAMKQTKPGNVTGLLVCDNVDTSGISGATQRERELIKSYLESGIIVNHPE